MTCVVCLFFFFNDTATTEIYTLSLHDALPILRVQGRGIPMGHTVWVAGRQVPVDPQGNFVAEEILPAGAHTVEVARSEEHTSELQSRSDLVCRLLLEKKNTDVRTREMLSTTQL